MRTIVTHTYQTADGKIFANQEAAEAHERTLPRITVYLVEIAPQEPKDSHEVAVYEYGYTRDENVWIEASGGFLGQDAHWSTERKWIKRGRVQGTWKAVLEHALKDDYFFDYRWNSYIHKIDIPKV